jgi:hypothetical protein
VTPAEMDEAPRGKNADGKELRRTSMVDAATLARPSGNGKGERLRGRASEWEWRGARSQPSPSAAGHGR